MCRATHATEKQLPLGRRAAAGGRRGDNVGRVRPGDQHAAAFGSGPVEHGPGGAPIGDYGRAQPAVECSSYGELVPRVDVQLVGQRRTTPRSGCLAAQELVDGRQLAAYLGRLAPRRLDGSLSPAQRGAGLLDARISGLTP
jgi:hypothetical protein